MAEAEITKTIEERQSMKKLIFWLGLIVFALILVGLLFSPRPACAGTCPPPTATERPTETQPQLTPTLEIQTDTPQATNTPQGTPTLVTTPTGTDNPTKMPLDTPQATLTIVFMTVTAWPTSTLGTFTPNNTSTPADTPTLTATPPDYQPSPTPTWLWYFGMGSG
jgi:hypothetical protein